MVAFVVSVLLLTFVLGYTVQKTQHRLDLIRPRQLKALNPTS